jgi:hypothetical protein
MQNPIMMNIIDNIPIEEKIRKHTIYHIPGVKVGCTVDFNNRKKDYKEDTVFETLEVIECTDQFAGDREWYWADALGYERGPHYAEFNWSINMTPEQRSAAGKALSKEKRREVCTKGGAKTASLRKNPFQTGVAQRTSVRSPNHISKREDNPTKTGIAQKASAKSPKHNTKQTYTCPHCNSTGKGPTMKRHHFNNCKWRLENSHVVI